MLRIAIIAAALFFFPLRLFSQEQLLLKNRTDSVTFLVKAIQKDGYFTSVGVGLNGEISTQYIRFAFLQELITNEELIELLENGRGCIRVYAYMGLLCNKHPESTIFQKILVKDSTVIPTMFGCDINLTSISTLIREVSHSWCPKENLIEGLTLLIQTREIRNREFKKLINNEN